MSIAPLSRVPDFQQPFEHLHRRHAHEADDVPVAHGEHQEQEQDAQQDGVAVDLLQRDQQGLALQLAEELRQGERGAADVQTVERRAEREGVGLLYHLEQTGGEGVGYRRTDALADEAHGAERLEEEDEGHQLLQVGRQGNVEDDVPEVAHEDGEVELTEGGLGRNEEVALHLVRQHADEAQDGQLLVRQVKPRQCVEREGGSGERAEQRGQVEACRRQTVIAEYHSRKDPLEHRRRGAEQAEGGEEQDDGDDLRVTIDLRVDVGVADVVHPSDVQRHAADACRQRRTEQGRVEPVVVVAVVRHEDEEPQPRAPQQGAEPVDAVQRHGLAHVEGAQEQPRTAEDAQQQGDDDELHVLPVVVVGEPRGEVARHLDAPEDGGIDHGEEDGEVACGRDAQLDGGEALEGPPHAEHPGDEAGHHEQRDAAAVHRDEVAGDEPRTRHLQDEARRQPELQPEEEGEGHGDAQEGGQPRHEQVLLHQGGLALHVGQGGQVDAARELEDEDERVERPCTHVHGHPLLEGRELAQEFVKMAHGLVGCFAFDIQPRAQPLQVGGTVRVREHDFDGDALLHLDEVARGVVLRDEGVLGAGRLGERLHEPLVGHARDGVDADADLHALGKVGGLRLPVVGYHPDVVVVHHGEEHLTGLHELSLLHGTARGDPVAGGGDDGVGEVEACQVEGSLGDGHGGVVLVQPLGLLLTDEGGRPALPQEAFVVCLEGFVVGAHVVELLRGDGFLFEQGAVAVVVLLGVEQADVHFLDAGIGDGEVVARGGDGRAHGAPSDEGAQAVGFRLGET